MLFLLHSLALAAETEGFVGREYIKTFEHNSFIVCMLIINSCMFYVNLFARTYT